MYEVRQPRCNGTYLDGYSYLDVPYVQGIAKEEMRKKDCCCEYLSNLAGQGS
ncbi:uncharacterized protein ANIA_11562 [Aspergillus nidulans FGSC A4]|uniref:Uncharacterized protein n=1 Tax=Emericella nidulans (strain FGSC A4 / ATCC 38163 / CBS 112.46 / NRRL 194 / M139) TaxID=227321 RepID=C8VB93_EMENI|nr:hypothetical protein [Aspergillus nidulans FGSC A4]CBF79347.1 TPA: hypothetical protein ANIA_11562 [Aspergillus nidulans FGSC A4]